MSDESEKAPVGDQSPPERIEGENTKVMDLLERVKSGELDVTSAAKQIRTSTIAAAGALISMASGPGIPDAKEEGKPSWAVVPSDLKIPIGLQVVYVRIPAIWTRYRHKGITLPGVEGKFRTCICWENTDGEETQAYRRALGDIGRAQGELAKQMIRSVDGRVADWGATASEPSSVDGFWTEIGAKGRGLVGRVYTQLHSLAPAEQILFFESCVESRFGA
jgi:hypothetical protein